MDSVETDRPVPPLDFSKVFATIGAEHFFSEIWEKHPALLELQGEDFARICGIVGPLEIERLANLASEGTQAWLSNAYIEHSVLPVDAATARQYFEIGATLYFLNVPMPALTDTIADTIGAPRDRMIASLFLTSAQGGAAPHFDKNENFTIQLTGQKSWNVANEPTIPNPPKGYFFGRAIPPALKRLGMHSQQPPPGRRYTLTPGTMLYVPRGTAHSTRAEEQSWSLNISYTGLMWADLITGALYEHLLAKPDWRRSVAGLGAQSGQAASGQNIVSALLADLRQALAAEDFAELMHARLHGLEG